MIRASRPDDLASVEALLTRARLPIDGVGEHFASFFVVDEAGRILAAAGVEIHGHDALLRSCAPWLSPTRREEVASARY